MDSRNNDLIATSDQRNGALVAGENNRQNEKKLFSSLKIYVRELRAEIHGQKARHINGGTCW